MKTVGQLKKEYDHFVTSQKAKVFLTDAGNIEYLISGKGEETILMFHGLAGNAYSLYRFILELQNDYKIVAPSIPAFNNLSANQVCESIELLLEHEVLVPTIVIGGSFGGLLAQAYWFRNPSTTKRVVLFDTSPPDRAMGIRNRKASQILHYLPWWLVKPLFKIRLLRLFKVTKKHSEEERDLLLFGRQQLDERFKNVTKELLMSHGNIAFDIMINCRVPDLANWFGRLLIMYSNDDPATKETSGLFNTSYPFAKIVTFIGAGHLGSLLYFDKYVEEIRATLLKDNNQER